MRKYSETFELTLNSFQFQGQEMHHLNFDF